MTKIGKIEPARLSPPAGDASDVTDVYVVNSNSVAVRRTNEVEFLPAALSVLEKPPNPASRVLAIVICLIVVFVVAWSIWGRVDINVVARGLVEVHGGVKQVQALETSRVAAILVEEGDFVEAGQLLIELDNTGPDVDVRRVRRTIGLAILQLQRHRLLIEAIEKGELVASLSQSEEPVDRETFLKESAQLRHDFENYWANYSRIQQEIAIITSKKSVVENQIKRLNEIYPIYEKLYLNQITLQKKGIVATSQVDGVNLRRLDKLSELEANQRRLEEIDLTLDRARDDLLRTAVQRTQQENERALEALTTLRENQILLKRLEQRQKDFDLRAPVTGYVHQLTARTVAGVVEPAETLMTIVPQESRLIVKAAVQNRDRGFVEPGLPVSLKFDTFNFTRYGTIAGKVEKVSTNSIDDSDLGPVFIVEISLESHELMVDGELQKITPGMAASAEMHIGERAIIEFLLSPIRRYGSEAIRER